MVTWIGLVSSSSRIEPPPDRPPIFPKPLPDRSGWEAWGPPPIPRCSSTAGILGECFPFPKALKGQGKRMWWWRWDVGCRWKEQDWMLTYWDRWSQHCVSCQAWRTWWRRWRIWWGWSNGSGGMMVLYWDVRMCERWRCGWWWWWLVTWLVEVRLDEILKIWTVYQFESTVCTVHRRARM